MIISMVLKEFNELEQQEVKASFQSPVFRRLVIKMQEQYASQMLTLNPDSSTLIVDYKVLRNSMQHWIEFEQLIKKLDEESKVHQPEREF